MHEPITLRRDVEAITIPNGARELLRGGTVVRLSQACGDSYTVVNDLGYQYRVDAVDSDALGLEVKNDGVSRLEFSEHAVWDLLRTVFDPEIPVNIVDLGLIYSCRIESTSEGHRIDVSMTMTAPGCGMADVLKAEVVRKLRSLDSVKEVTVAVVFDPPWNPRRMSQDAKLQLGFDLDSDEDPSDLPIFGR